MDGSAQQAPKGLNQPGLDWCADDRRVYRAELKLALGWGDTWLNEQIKAGNVDPPLTDPGGKRQFWTARKAREIVTRLNNAAAPMVRAKATR